MTSLLSMSHALLWVANIVLGLTVLALVRQVGVLHERIAPAGALAVNNQRKVGDKVPALPLTTLAGRSILTDSSNRSRLYFFLSPDCPVCKTLLPAIRSLAGAEKQTLEVVLASDGASKDHRGFISTHNLEGFDYVVSEELGRALGVSKLPYGVLVGPDGAIAAMGIVNSREHLESLLEAQERGVASIQDYMKRRVTAD
ncbi:redoxin domain-containing protein [Kordiimonas sp.]|uniref:redoxin domain-containing protein n=1 Tax=Kordiimonas sp. TaxID=1970157 RepID=UPI003A9093AE